MSRKMSRVFPNIQTVHLGNLWYFPRCSIYKYVICPQWAPEMVHLFGINVSKGNISNVTVNLYKSFIVIYVSFCNQFAMCGDLYVTEIWNLDISYRNASYTQFVWLIYLQLVDYPFKIYKTLKSTVEVDIFAWPKVSKAEIFMGNNLSEDHNITTLKLCFVFSFRLWKSYLMKIAINMEFDHKIIVSQ